MSTTLPPAAPDTIAHVRDSVIDRAWACVPQALPAEQRAALKARAAQLLRELGAVLVSHYYVDADLQDLALETGGCVSDSLEMARFGRDHAAKTLIVAGVRFMGETSKILSPDKRVFMPALEAECSLDLGCPADEFAKFCDAHPDRTVVVYANTSAGREGARRLVRHIERWARHRAPSARARAEDPLGARQASGPLHPGTDRRRHGPVARRVHRA